MGWGGGRTGKPFWLTLVHISVEQIWNSEGVSAGLRVGWGLGSAGGWVVSAGGGVGVGVWGGSS